MLDFKSRSTAHRVATDAYTGSCGSVDKAGYRADSPGGAAVMVNAPKSRNYKRLARNMVIIIVLAAIIPLALVQGLTLFIFSDAYRSKVREHMGELVQKHSQNIDRFLYERLADIRMLARSNTVHELSDSLFLRHRLSMLREEYNGVFVDMGLVNAEGGQVAYAGPYNLFGADYSDTYWFKQALASEQYISDVFTGLRGSPHFIVAYKLVREGRPWILRATIDFETFNQLVGNIRLGKTGFAFILNRAGEFQTKPRIEIDLIGEPFLDFLRQRPDIKSVTVFVTKDNSGRKSLMVMAPLKRGQWILGCRQESRDAFLVLGVGEYAALATLVLAAIIVGLASYVMAGRMVGRLEEVDKQRAVMNEKVIEAGRLASIGELAAGIAHEINNPVAIMVEEAGWIQDLMADGELKTREDFTELERALAQIKTQGGRCKEITHKLLSFARKTDSRICEVDLNRLALDAVSLLRQKTRYANTRILTDLDEKTPSICASPTEIQQVLVNLINNAVDALGSSGGEVVLSTRLDGDEVGMTVSDNGPGIPESEIDRIFDPFFTTKPVGRGTGLGLSICFGIVNKLGGSIRVRSRAGEGTSFIIRFPAACGKSTEIPPMRGEDTEEQHSSEESNESDYRVAGR